MVTKSEAKVVHLAEVSNDAEFDIKMSEPYAVTLTLEGSSDLLLKAWSPEAVKQKGKEKKNSLAKKTDNIESYIHRNELEQICLPGEYLRMSICNSAKFRQ